MLDANGQPQSVLVIGGGSDIAKELLKLMSRSKLENVILAGPNFSSMEPVRKELQIISPVKVDLVFFDISDLDSIEAFVNASFDELGPIDLVVMAAGQLGDQTSDEEDLSRIKSQIMVNFTGPALAMTACATKMKSQGYGSLVLLSSVAGEKIRRSNFLYGSTKGAIDGFVQGMQVALLSQNIKILIVRPGFVQTKMTSHLKSVPLATTAEAVAKDISIALETGSEIIWSPKIMRIVMAILRHIPRKLARRLPF